MGVLSDALRAIRLEGALFLNGEMHAPWCVNVPRGGEIAQALKPQARRLAICHLILEGRCWVQVDGEDPHFVRTKEGRPAKGTPSSTTRTKSVRFPKEVWDALEKQAEKKGITLHAALRKAIVEWLKRAA